jgi:hypothetical protein
MLIVSVRHSFKRWSERELARRGSTREYQNIVLAKLVSSL